LNAVHFAENGATVASDGFVMMAVGPVDEEHVSFPDVGEQAAPSAGGVSVDLDIVNQAFKNLPKKGKRASLQNTAMTRCAAKVEFTTTDLKKEQRVAGKFVQGVFPAWTDILRRAQSACGVGRVCLRRRQLITLLEAMDNAAGDSGDKGPVFIEFGGEGDTVMLRTQNHATGQHVIGVVQPLGVDGHWIEQDDWERSIFQDDTEREARNVEAKEESSQAHPGSSEAS
jgi:hypothetical protein